jgi:integrase
MGKNHKDRDLMLVPQAKEILALYSGKDNKPTDYIFPLLDNNASWAQAVTQAEKDIMSPAEKVKLFKNISSKNALINKGLKIIGKAVGLTKNLSFHISRHSFARLAKERGIDNNNVKSLLAHSSLKITEGYMGNFDTSLNDKALISVFESPKESNKSLVEQLKSLSPEELANIIRQL